MLKRLISIMVVMAMATAMSMVAYADELSEVTWDFGAEEEPGDVNADEAGGTAVENEGTDGAVDSDIDGVAADELNEGIENESPDLEENEPFEGAEALEPSEFDEDEAVEDAGADVAADVVADVVADVAEGDEVASEPMDDPVDDATSDDDLFDVDYMLDTPINEYQSLYNPDDTAYSTSESAYDYGSNESLDSYYDYFDEYDYEYVNLNNDTGADGSTTETKNPDMGDRSGSKLLSIVAGLSAVAALCWVNRRQVRVTGE